MEMRVVCLVSVWACAFLTTLVMASPSQGRGADEADVEDVFDDALLPPNTYFGLAPPSLVLDEDFAEDDDEDTFTRRRRLLSGVHSRYSGSGRRFRSRPRVYVPRGRHASRGSSRNNVSPY